MNLPLRGWPLLAAILTFIASTSATAQPAPAADFDDLRSPAPGPSAPLTTLSSEVDDESDFRELVRYAARQTLTDAEKERCAAIVDRLGFRHPVRRAVARLLNRKGGKLDRWVNQILMKRAWKKHGPLPNLASLDGAVMRGGEPSEEGFKELARQGVRTVVNLRMEDEAEKPLVAAQGMRYVYLPIPDTDAPTLAQTESFLELCAAARADAKLFFHCAAGIYRTGTMAALYRVAHGMSAEEALAEAGQFGWKENWLNADREATFVRGWARVHHPLPSGKLDFGRTPLDGGTDPETP